MSLNQISLLRRVRLCSFIEKGSDLLYPDYFIRTLRLFTSYLRRSYALWMLPCARTLPCLLLPALLLGQHRESVKQPVEILRDRWGVPHIYAQNSGDLFFGQGYIT